MGISRVMSAVVGIAVTLVVLIAIFFFESRADVGARNIVDKATCGESVKLNAQFRVSGATAGVDLKCPTLFIKVNGNNPNVIFESAALAMADTWDEFLRGREEVFDTTTDDFCVIRRVLEFDHSNVYKGFFDYTLTHNYQGLTEYYSYLTDISVDAGAQLEKDNSALKTLDTIDTKTPYAAVFVMSKKTGFTKVLGSTVGLIFGSSYPSNWDAGMILIPYTEENLKALNCNKLPVSVIQTENATGNK